LGVRVAVGGAVTLGAAAVVGLLALAVGIDDEVAVGLAGLAVAALAFVFGKLIPARRLPEPEQRITVPEPPLPQLGPPAHGPRIVVGDLPGEAVAWQDRTDLLDRLAAIAGSGQAAVVCAVAGLRGIGKTQLAAAYARDRARRGWPVMVWIDAETETSLLAGLDALAGQAGIRQDGVDPAQTAKAAMAWLRTADNVPRRDQQISCLRWSQRCMDGL
jgi:hypothetical protein